ncbi:MAG TPA: PQQ-dependent sugar dehydrogenase [Labilithrix sp.]|jgi:glucose/arabinose dehydrogenase
MSRFGVVALSVLALVACTRRAPYCTYVRAGDGPSGAVPIRAETVVSGLEVPWSIAFLTNDAMLVTERPGRLRLVAGGVLEPQPVATIPVHTVEEGGLLGLALAPDFGSSRRFFLYYTYDGADGYAHDRVERWILADDARSAQPDKILFDPIAAAPFHNGGRLRVGPDGMLWIGTGDAGNPKTAQDAYTPNGKILRVTLDGDPAPDNPVPGSPVWASGLRNVEAFDWLSPKPGAPLVIAEHGPSGELGRHGNDRILVSFPGANHGWPDSYGCDDGDGVTGASLSWAKAVPPGGAALYTGTRIPEWRGSFLVGTLLSQHIHRVVLDPNDPKRVVLHEVYLAGELGRVRDVVMSPDGELYVATSNCDSRGTCPPDGDRIVRITR